MVGYSEGVHKIELSQNGCMELSTVVHEIMHMLGYHHEHQRPDRPMLVFSDRLFSFNFIDKDLFQLIKTDEASHNHHHFSTIHKPIA